jgi:Trypsin-co-occurring domain 1
MTRLAEFPVDGGGTVLVAIPGVDGRTSGADLFRGGAQEVVQRSAYTVESAIGRLRPAAQAIIDGFTALPRRPDEVSVTFGVELSAAVGAIIASTSAQANFAVTLTWHKVEIESPGRTPP